VALSGLEPERPLGPRILNRRWRRRRLRNRRTQGRSSTKADRCRKAWPTLWPTHREDPSEGRAGEFTAHVAVQRPGQDTPAAAERQLVTASHARCRLTMVEGLSIAIRRPKRSDTRSSKPRVAGSSPAGRAGHSDDLASPGSDELGRLGTGGAQTSTLQTTGDVDPVGCSPTAEQATAGEPSDAIDPAAHQPVITAEGAVERSRVHRPSHLGVASSNGGPNSSPRTSSSVVDRREIQGDPTTEDDAEPPRFLASGQEPPSVGGVFDAVEAALAAAMCAATAAGRFDVVSQLARELEARRCARAGNVVRLEPSRGKGADA
jgi:hypothetical protein